MADADGPCALFGTAGEVMYQHQHSPLPLQQLEGVPQPVIALVEVLLEKDPRLRFQTAAELLKAVQTVTGAIEAGCAIAPQGLRQIRTGDSRLLRRMPARLGPEKDFDSQIAGHRK